MPAHGSGVMMRRGWEFRYCQPLAKHMDDLSVNRAVLAGGELHQSRVQVWTSADNEGASSYCPGIPDLVEQFCSKGLVSLQHVTAPVRHLKVVEVITPAANSRDDVVDMHGMSQRSRAERANAVHSFPEHRQQCPSEFRVRPLLHDLARRAGRGVWSGGVLCVFNASAISQRTAAPRDGNRLAKRKSSSCLSSSSSMTNVTSGLVLAMMSSLATLIGSVLLVDIILSCYQVM